MSFISTNTSIPSNKNLVRHKQNNRLRFAPTHDADKLLHYPVDERSENNNNLNTGGGNNDSTSRTSTTLTREYSSPQHYRRDVPQSYATIPLQQHEKQKQQKSHVDNEYTTSSVTSSSIYSSSINSSNTQNKQRAASQVLNNYHHHRHHPTKKQYHSNEQMKGNTASFSSANDGGGGGGRRRVSTIDHRRVPKIASFLLLLFFGISGFHYIINQPSSFVDGDTTTSVTAATDESNGNNQNEENTFNEEHQNNNDESTNNNDPSLLLSIEEQQEQIRQKNALVLSSPQLDRNGKSIHVPTQLANLANIFEEGEEYPPKIPINNGRDKPLFWHVPRCGGTTVKEIASFCLGLTTASEVGGRIISSSQQPPQQELQIITDVETGAKYLNVDTTSLEGISQAKEWNVASFPQLDLISTPYIYQATDQLFNYVNRGRMFVMLRHPIDRAVSMYYHLSYSSSMAVAEQGGGSIGNDAGMMHSLEAYAKSSMVENNWMTRFLSNKLGGELTVDDEALAKEILRTKSLIGLITKKAESMRRFELYFQWSNAATANTPISAMKKSAGTARTGPTFSLMDDTRRTECMDKFLNWGWNGKHKHPMIERDSDTWNLLQEQNTFDIRLYEYAEELFEAQGDIFTFGNK